MRRQFTLTPEIHGSILRRMWAPHSPACPFCDRVDTPRLVRPVHGARTIYAFECASCRRLWLEDVQGHTTATVVNIRERLRVRHRGTQPIG